MKKLRIANPQFEIELENEKKRPLIESYHLHPLFLQLQYIPYLYADHHDFILTTMHPEDGYHKRLESMGIEPAKGILLDAEFIPAYPIDCWGYTESLNNWTIKNKIPFETPDIHVVKKINRKDFSFSASPQLDGAKILSNREELITWMRSIAGTKVIKTVFGLSGRGHHFLQHEIDKQAESFLLRQWSKNLPVIGEPWVDRVIDFSTQWEIKKNQEIDYLGSTICCNDDKGRYKQTIVLPCDTIGEDFNDHLAEHKHISKNMIKLIASLGFFGNVGIDGMIYKKNGSLKLHPIVEINGRKTMGFTALALQRKHFRDKKISLQYKNDEIQKNLLPNFGIPRGGNTTHFGKILSLDILS